MAKIVIAGKSDCPYFARVELLADKLASSFNAFHVHKIVKTPQEWEKWITEECTKRKFIHTGKKSPIVWRELVDRGGKGILIGGANEFQEYAKGYYGIKSPLVTTDVTKISEENYKTKEEISKEEDAFRKLSNPMKICITNASSPVCYHLLDTIASGEIFGKENELAINLLGNSDELSNLAGLEMEVKDMAYNVVRKVNVTASDKEALTDCEAVIILDQLTRIEDEAEDAWLKRNCDMLVQRIKVIDSVCKKTVKVLVGGTGPINTGLFMMLKEVKNIDKKNIITMPRLVENQAKALLSQKVNVKTSDIVDVIVWGDNENFFCDINQARVHNHDGPIWGPPSYSRLAALLIHEEQWLEKDFLEALPSRYSAEKEKLRRSPVFGHAAAITSLMKHWWSGSPEDQLFTIGVSSEGWYNVPEGMVFNFPAKLLPAGTWQVMEDCDISDTNKTKLKECVDYLLEQRYQLFPEERPPPPPEPKPEVPLSDSPKPPTMTPIKEETDQELKPNEDTEPDTTESQSESEHHKPTSAEPTLGKIQETEEPEEQQPNKEEETAAPTEENEVGGEDVQPAAEPEANTEEQ